MFSMSLSLYKLVSSGEAQSFEADFVSWNYVSSVKRYRQTGMGRVLSGLPTQNLSLSFVSLAFMRLLDVSRRRADSIFYPTVVRANPKIPSLRSFELHGSYTSITPHNLFHYLLTRSALIVVH